MDKEFSPGNCGGSVPAGGSCEISVTFTPSASVTRSAEIGVFDSELNSPQSFAVSGTGTFLSVAPKRLTFPGEPVGTTSPPMYVTIKNVGTSSFKLSIGDSDSAEFPEKPACGRSLAAGVTCDIKVWFKPAATGAQSATLSITDAAGGSPLKAALEGTGT